MMTSPITSQHLVVQILSTVSVSRTNCKRAVGTISAIRTAALDSQSFARAQYLINRARFKPFSKMTGMINNEVKSSEYSTDPFAGIIPWQQFKNVQWKNPRASAREAYSPTTIEHIANVITHGIWVVPSVLAVFELIKRSENGAQFFSALVYGATLIMIFTVSTTFHCVFYCNKNRPLKDVLHRCDRAMIYVFIAGSYFPWLTLQQLPEEGWSSIMRWLVWILAAIGIGYQQAFHERYKSLETLIYLIMGIGPSVPLMTEHEFSGAAELKIGGVIYMMGVVFFKADGSIPCAHAIWHLFVVAAAGVHYFAILNNLYPLPLVDSTPVQQFS